MIAFLAIKSLGLKEVRLSILRIRSKIALPENGKATSGRVDSLSPLIIATALSFVAVDVSRVKETSGEIA